MDGTIIAIICLGIISLIATIAIVGTYEESKKLRNLLDNINTKLDETNFKLAIIGNNTWSSTNQPTQTINNYPQNTTSTTNSSPSKGGAWNCKCGSRVYGSDVCRSCGARRDQQ